MTDVTNSQRAQWAELALRQFIERTGCDREDSLGDLLCDLMHWSKQNNFDFDIAMDRAYSHFEAESAEVKGNVIDRVTDALFALQAALVALVALNLKPRFKVPSLGKNSYDIAAQIERALAAFPDQ